MQISEYANTSIELEFDINADELVGEATDVVEEIIDEHIKPLVQRIMHLEKLAGMAHDEHGTPFDPAVKAEAEAARAMEEMADADERREQALSREATVKSWDGNLSVVESAAEYIKLGWTADQLREAWQLAGMPADQLGQVLAAADSLVQLGFVTREVQV